MEDMQKIISLAKRRGFIFPASDIYDGLGGVYDFGPLGVATVNNLKMAWWQEMTRNHENIVGLDSAILMNKKVLQASGHLSAGFADNLLECKQCRRRFKEDEVDGRSCPACGGELSEPRKFNLLMKTFIGPVEDEASVAYLRPETCQGIYINFLNVLNSMRLKIPFGIAQIGKAFRNEINPKNFIFRNREFEQMEMQWFCSPKEVEKYFDYWKKERLAWYEVMGLKKENLRVKEIPEGERAHYAQRQVDIEYHFPFGWGEIEGIHNRGDWDLKNHSQHSGRDLSYCEEKNGERYYPNVIETSIGVGRSFLAFFCDAFEEVAGGRTKTTEAVKEEEILLRLSKYLSPVNVLVLPLVKNKPALQEKAREVYRMLKKDFSCQYDDVGSIGRRYRRGDEIGINYALTIDFESLENDDLTVRDRDSMKQERLKIKELKDFFNERLTL
jgi:glycyl-tRNA synthetase